MRTIKIVLSLARAATRLSATTRRAAALLALAMFSVLAVNADEVQYYLVGTMTEWADQEAYKLIKGNGDEYYSSTFYMTKDTELKVRTGNTYYPDNVENYKIGSNGYYKVYFKPNGTGGDDWYYKTIYVKDMSTDFYFYSNISGWAAKQEYKLQQNPDNTNEFFIDVALSNNDEFKVVKSMNGSEIDKYYPDNVGNYKITSDGIYSIYFRPNYDGSTGWWEKTIYISNSTNASVSMAAEGYGTYYNSKFDATLPAGVEAKIVTAANSNGKLTYQTIATGDNSGKSSANTVPAGTAVLLQGTSGNLTLSSHDTNITTPSINLLHGSDVATTTTGGGTYYKYYKLSYQNGYTESDKKIGWYWGADNGDAFTSGAHKAWLVLPAVSATRAFFDLPDSDEKTGISATRIVETKDNWYSIDGRRLNGKPVQRGVYINNGKKIIIK